MKGRKAMKIEGLHEKEIFSNKQPFRMLVNKDVDFCYPSHWHSAIELVYVVENDFVVKTSSDTYTMQEGDILYIPSGDLHECKATTTTGTRIFINFDLSSLCFYDNWESLLRNLSDTLLITPDDGCLYKQIAVQLKSILEENAPSDHLIYLARMIDILLLLCKYNSKPINFSTVTDVNNKAVGLEKINKSFEYIEKNYSKDISLKKIAQVVGFSEYYFSHLFKEITEKSFHQYLNEFRIRKARIMLTDLNCSVSQAAYASGFSSITTFNRLFRKINGYSPQEFRKLKR
jgi:AraC-like DNA-binding protein